MKMKIVNRRIVAEREGVRIYMGAIGDTYVELYMDYYTDPSPSNPVGGSIELTVWRYKCGGGEERIKIGYKEVTRYSFIKEDKL